MDFLKGSNKHEGIILKIAKEAGETYIFKTRDLYMIVGFSILKDDGKFPNIII